MGWYYHATQSFYMTVSTQENNHTNYKTYCLAEFDDYFKQYKFYLDKSKPILEVDYATA